MIYEPIAESATVLRALEATGSAWRVRVMRYGESKNGWTWDEESGRALLPFLEHAPVGLYQFKEGLTAHASDQAVYKADGAVVRNVVADLTAPVLESDGVYATLTIHDDAPWLKAKLLGLEQRGIVDKVLGLSVDTLAAVVKETVGSVVRKAIRAIQKLNSVDIVTAPSADGRFVRAVAGPLWPDITASASERHSEVLPMADETIPTTKGPTAAELTAIREAEDATKKAADAAKVAHEGELAKITKIREAQEAELAKFRELQDRMRVMESDQRVREAVAVTTLPDPIKEKVIKAHTGRFVEAEALTAAIREEADAWAKVAASMGNVKGFGGGRIEVGPDSEDKMQAGLDRLFGHKRDEFNKVLESAPMSENGRARVREAHKAADEAARADAGIGFTSLKQAYVAFTGDRDMTFRVPMRPRRLTEAQVITTTWGDALGNTLYRRLVAAYAEPQYNEQSITRFGTAPDFRTREVAHVGYFPDLSAVAENAVYTEIALPSDEKVSYAVGKYGNLFPITMETIANDDLNVVMREISNLGRAARRTLAQFIWNFWINNSAWDVDGNVWFKNSTNRGSATGGNTGSTLLVGAPTLTMANEILAKVQQLGMMTERTSGKLLGLPPLDSLWLDVPFGSMGTAWQLNEALEFGTGNVNPVREMFGANRARINVNPLFTDTSNWGVHVDPRTGGRESIGVDFWQGREEPLLELQDQRTVGDVFLYDRVTYKISHIYGGDLIDVYGAASNRHL